MAQSLETLVSLYGPVDETMETLGQIAKSPAAKEAFSELESVFALLQTRAIRAKHRAGLFHRLQH